MDHMIELYDDWYIGL